MLPCSRAWASPASLNLAGVIAIMFRPHYINKYPQCLCASSACLLGAQIPKDDPLAFVIHHLTVGFLPRLLWV